MENVPSRTDNSVRNSLFALGSRFLSIFAMFACRTVFIRMLGAEYLGISGLFSNILSILSLSELGIGTAILSTMYKPVAQGDREHVKALLALFGKAYRIIGATVLVMGLVLLPFLGLFMKEKSQVPDITLIYILYLADTVLSYFLSYKQSILDADQKSYLIDMNDMKFELGKNALQIVVLLSTRNFLLYLGCQILFGFFKNLNIYRKADRLYPYIKGKNREKLTVENRKQVVRNIKAMITHQVGDVFVNSTDSIMISTFIGVYWMGLYSNYLLISTTVHGILVQMLNAVTASVGNLTATEDPEKRYVVFRQIFLVNSWIFGFSAVCLWMLMDPFISVWVGNAYHLPLAAVALVCANFLFTGMRKTAIIFRNTHGLFWNDRFNPIAEAVVNLAVSIVLVKYIGLPGILLGKLISTLTTCMWVEPYVLFKHGFRKPLRLYFKQYALNMVIVFLAAGTTHLLGTLLPLDGWPELLYKLSLCMVVPNAVFLLAWGRSDSFRHLKGIAMEKLLHRT